MQRWGNEEGSWLCHLMYGGLCPIGKDPISKGYALGWGATRIKQSFPGRT